MAKNQGGGKLLPLPFTTFGELAAHGLKAKVYCSCCYEHRPIDATAEQLRERCFATIRFRCTKIRYTGAVCGCLGSVEIEPCVLLPVGGEDTLAFLSCGTCLPSWEINYVPIDRPPWSVVNRDRGDRFKFVTADDCLLAGRLGVLSLPVSDSNTLPRGSNFK
jgi:hypothetical protein